MDEIEHQHGKFFDGTVGTLQQVEDLGSCILTREPLAGENPELVLVLAGESTPSAEDAQITIPACASFQCRNIRPQLPYQPRSNQVALTLFLLAGIVGVLIPILIIYQLSRFHHGRSSIAQRVWIMTWLAFGWYIGVAFGSMMVPKAHSILKQRTALMVVSMRVAFSVPAIGGGGSGWADDKRVWRL